MRTNNQTLLHNVTVPFEAADEVISPGSSGAGVSGGGVEEGEVEPEEP